MSEQEMIDYLTSTGLYETTDKSINPQWSQPVYVCPKCGGGMCKNLWVRRSLATMPPIIEYEYRCDNEQCRNVEYLRR